MELGRAEQKLQAGDTAGAATLVGEAREDTQRALAELRDLARGIRPALLSERGLREAITSLAARAGVPDDGRLRPRRRPCRPPSRPPPTSSSARRSRTSASTPRRSRRRCASSAAAAASRSRSATTAAAAPNPEGSGLTGLRKRVEALDGTLFLSSPAGGPTILRAELPCAS